MMKSVDKGYTLPDQINIGGLTIEKHTLVSYWNMSDIPSKSGIRLTRRCYSTERIPATEIEYLARGERALLVLNPVLNIK